MTISFRVIIPARYGATRLPGKLLKDIAGKPLLQHAYESAKASQAEEVIIATDDERIVDAASGFGARVLLTSDTHQSGTDRIAEAVGKLSLDPSSIIVNVQGDEFGLSSNIINQLAESLNKQESIKMATLCKEILDKKQYQDPDAVKVVRNSKNEALIFSRAPLPWGVSGFDKLKQKAYLHIGLYAYRVEFLDTFTKLDSCELEESERLEQLRVLYHGHKIHVEEAVEACGIGVDNLADLELARKIAAAN